VGDVVNPQGYVPYDGLAGLDTLYYIEYNNTGSGAMTNGRVK
jgi:pectinesterase